MTIEKIEPCEISPKAAGADLEITTDKTIAWTDVYSTTGSCKNYCSDAKVEQKNMNGGATTWFDFKDLHTDVSVDPNTGLKIATTQYGKGDKLTFRTTCRGVNSNEFTVTFGIVGSPSCNIVATTQADIEFL